MVLEVTSDVLIPSRDSCEMPVIREGRQNAGGNADRFVSIPLLLRGHTASQSRDLQHEPTLAVTVLLTDSFVEQEWVGFSPGLASPRFPSDGNEREHASQEQTWDAVRYLIPLRTLNAFTDQHGIPRIAAGSGTSAFVCPVFRKLSELILPTVAMPRMFSATFMDNFVMLFCSHVVQRRAIHMAQQTAHRGGLSNAQRKKITEFLVANIERHLRLAVLAHQCGLSVSHFSRAFKKSFGLPVYRWITLHRIERAKHLLLSSEAALLDIGLQSGFSDQASFNRTFAKLVGTSPGRWRRSFKA